MEKGIKVVAVNDPFIDPEYMVSSRWGEGPARVALVLRRFQDLNGKPCRTFPEAGGDLSGVACSAT